MAVPDFLTERIERFKRNRVRYEGVHYREDELRREFTDSPFAALGWDVRNTHAYVEAYKNAVTKLSAKAGESPRAPDYAFRVGGTTKFLVKASRPKVKVRMSAPSFQLHGHTLTMGLSQSVAADLRSSSKPRPPVR